jgi:hypothetical protein
MGQMKWFIWHAEWCRRLHLVLWVDDVTMQWEQVPEPIVVVGGNVRSNVHQAKKIVIDLHNLMVTINPIEGVQEDSLTLSEEVTCGAH